MLAVAGRESANSALHCFHAFAAGADDRIDELAVRILVPAVHEFGEREAPIGPLIVAPAEIERANGIVNRPDEVHAPEAPGHEFGGVPQGSGFERPELLTRMANDEPVRAVRLDVSPEGAMIYEIT